MGLPERNPTACSGTLAIGAEKFFLTRHTIVRWRSKVMAQKQTKDIINGKVVPVGCSPRTTP